ncbi:hypothetical protein D3C75_1280590 [compost metagenome]
MESLTAFFVSHLDHIHCNNNVEAVIFETEPLILAVLTFGAKWASFGGKHILSSALGELSMDFANDSNWMTKSRVYRISEVEVADI